MCALFVGLPDVAMAAERLTYKGRERLVGLLRAADPRRELWFTWNAKEVVRQIYDLADPALAAEWIDAIIRDFADGEMPIEVRQLGRTIKRWRSEIPAWHESHVSSGPTEAINNLVKRVKRVSVNRPSLACSSMVRDGWTGRVRLRTCGPVWRFAVRVERVDGSHRIVDGPLIDGDVANAYLSHLEVWTVVGTTVRVHGSLTNIRNMN